MSNTFVLLVFIVLFAIGFSIVFPRLHDVGDSIIESIFESSFITLWVLAYIFIPFYCLGWVAEYNYTEEHRIKVAHYTLWDKDGHLKKRSSLPNKVRNQSKDTLVLGWIGYGEVATKRDTLLPGQIIRYNDHIVNVTTMNEIPENESSYYQPAITIAIAPIHCVSKDKLDSIQQVDRTWSPKIAPWEIPNYD